MIRSHSSSPRESVAQVNLVAQLARPAGARHDQRNAVQFHLAQPVVFQVHDFLTEQRLHDHARLRTLQLQRRYIGFADLHVQPRMHGHALRPQQDVAVGQRDPEMVFGQRSRIGSFRMPPSALVMRTYLHCPTAIPTNRAGSASGRTSGSVRPGDLNLPFNRHVTQDGVVDQVPEVLFRVTEVTRDVHVVVDRETLARPSARSRRNRGICGSGCRNRNLLPVSCRMPLYE
jgi:hypothetical protein